MAQKIVLELEDFKWLDVVDPSREELAQVAIKYDLHPALVQDSLDPEHLPKHERAGDLGFLILRAYDEDASDDADTVQELTRKVAVFYSKKFLITIHRTNPKYLLRFIDGWSKRSPCADMPACILAELLGAVLTSYEAPIEKSLGEFDQFEIGLFEAPGSRPFEVGQGYFLKRKASVFKRMVRILSELLPKITNGFAIDAQILQDIREEGEHLYFYADELLESMNSLLNLSVSLASQKTNEASHRINEVVRVLTVFSVFLLPLNVLTGIYGMNFEHMPELKWQYGYPSVLLTMVLVTTSVYFWFRRKGWLK